MTTTYAELRQNIKDWMENDATEFDTELDKIIALSEERIYREIDLEVTHKDTTVTATINVATASLPSDFVLPRFLQIQNSTYLTRKDESFIRAYTPNSSTTGTPKYYSINTSNTKLFLGPTPSSTQTLVLGYTYRPSPLSASNTTTWLTANAEDLLLYSCLLEATHFMKPEQQTVAQWQALYDRALKTLQKEHMFRFRHDTYRSGELREP